MKKSVLITVKKHTIIVCAISLFSGFIIVFGLELFNEVKCRTIKSGFSQENYYEYKQKGLEYLQRVENKTDLNSEEKLQRDMFNSFKNSPLVVFDNSGPSPITNPCNIPAFTTNFITFFGNIVNTDKFEYNNFMFDIDKKDYFVRLSKQEPVCFYQDGKVIDRENSPPIIKYKTKYSSFQNPFSLCECEATPHKLKIYFEAAIIDYKYVLLFTVIIIVGFYIFKNFSLKIKILK